MLSFLGDTTLTKVLTSTLIVFALVYSITIWSIVYRAVRTPDTSPEPQVSEEHMHAITIRDAHGVLVFQPDEKMVVGVAQNPCNTGPRW